MTSYERPTEELRQVRIDQYGFNSRSYAYKVQRRWIVQDGPIHRYDGDPFSQADYRAHRVHLFHNLGPNPEWCLVKSEWRYRPEVTEEEARQ